MSDINPLSSLTYLLNRLESDIRDVHTQIGMLEFTFKNLQGSWLHREQAKDLAQKLVEKHVFSESVATHCARDIVRYKEAHGEKPTDSQIEPMVQISREVEKKYDTSVEKEVDHHTIDFLRRHEGDLIFRQRCLQDKANIALEYKAIQTQVRESLENQRHQTEQALFKQKEKDFSMSM